MAKFQDKLIADGYCDARGAGFCATATSLPGGVYGMVALCVREHVLYLYDVDMRGNIGELLHEIPLERIENLKIRTGFFSQVLRFEYEGAVFSFTNFVGVKPALEVIRQPRGADRNCQLLVWRTILCYTDGMEVFDMETKEILQHLRTEKGLSQDELAEKVFVTRQAVSRWENGETTPGLETLKRLSQLFDVSINTLLGSPRQLICQCCGMPLDDSTISKEPDGDFNEDYCKWCYADGTFKYTSKEQLIDFCVTHMASESWPAEQVRAHMEAVVPELKHWKK